MAICTACDQEMTESVGCTERFYSDYADGVARERVPYGDPLEEWEEFFARNPGLGPLVRCHDCFASVGGLHHPGCDMERCPKCGGQVISCQCEVSDGR